MSLPGPGAQVPGAQVPGAGITDALREAWAVQGPFDRHSDQYPVS